MRQQNKKTKESSLYLEVSYSTDNEAIKAEPTGIREKIKNLLINMRKEIKAI